MIHIKKIKKLASENSLHSISYVHFNTNNKNFLEYKNNLYTLYFFIRNKNLVRQINFEHFVF